MDIVLAMLASNAAKKIDEHKKFPYSIERHAQEGESVHSYALYRYFINNAIRYPQEWVINNHGAKTLVQITLKDGVASIDSVDILEKSDGLSYDEVMQEVTKTFNRAVKEFPANIAGLDEGLEQSVSFALPLEWKIMR